MKLVLLLFGVVLLASLAYGRPVGFEDEPEASPVPVAEQHLDTADQPKNVAQDPKITNGVFNPPKLCPQGQELDRLGKCRPIMG